MRGFLLTIAGAGVLLSAAIGSQAAAFDNTQFCQAMTLFARTTARDTGTWLNRTTRNDGVELFCDRKLVHFKRYANTPGSGLREAWREARTDEWRSSTCSNSTWREAVENGWLISTTITTVTGEKVWFACQPGGGAFHRLLP
jgi:hypothetical protein